MTVIFVSTGVSTGLMVDKMMKVAPGGLVVPLLPKQTQLQVQTPRLDVDFGVFIALSRGADQGFGGIWEKKKAGYRLIST